MNAAAERMTKAIVLLSLAGGFVFEMIHAPRPLPVLSLAVVPVMFYLGRTFEARAVGVTLAIGCLLPAVARMLTGRPPRCCRCGHSPCLRPCCRR